MHKLFQILSTIIASYTNLPINQLFENYLSLNLFIVSNPQFARYLCKHKFKLNKGKEQIFFMAQHDDNSPYDSMNLNKNRIISNKKLFVYLNFSHQKKVPIHKKLFGICQKKDGNKFSVKNDKIQSLICLSQENQIIDNIIQLNNYHYNKLSHAQQIRGLFFAIPYRKIQQAIQQISLYLSICELYHSHIGLSLSIHQCCNTAHLQTLLKISQKPFQQDDDQLLAHSIYCRIFQSLPYKITYEQISALGQIEQNFWGQLVTIQQGTDGILFWFLLRHLPVINKQKQRENNMLNLSQNQKKYLQRIGLKFAQAQNGHMLFKSKSKLIVKQSLQQLSLTIVIMDIKSQKYLQNFNQIFGKIFQTQLKRFHSVKRQLKEYRNCQKNQAEVERLCQLLCMIPDQNRMSFSGLNRRNSSWGEIQSGNEQEKMMSYDVNKWIWIAQKKLQIRPCQI